MITVDLRDPHFKENAEALLKLQRTRMFTDAELQEMYNRQLEKDAAADAQQACEHEYAYSDLCGRYMCKKCFRVLTLEETRAALEYANARRRAEEESDADSEQV